MATRSLQPFSARLQGKRLTRRQFGAVGLGALAVLLAGRAGGNAASPPSHVYQAPGGPTAGRDGPCACPMCTSIATGETRLA